MANAKRLKLSEGRVVAQGAFATVILVGEAKDEYAELLGRKDGLSAKQATQLERYFQRYAEHGDQQLSDEMFKSVGRRKDGAGNEHLIYEFKPFKYRVFGVVRNWRGTRHFVGTAVNVKKDQRKADPADLDRAAKGATAIEED
jgi:hypothetical protein